MRALVAILALSACNSTETRLCNDTGFDINTVAWDSEPFASMQAGECTAYEDVVGRAYETTTVTFRVQADAFYIQPIDHLGEMRLGDGRWSYHLTIADYAQRDANVHATRD